MNHQTDLRKLTITALFIALGVLLAPFSIPLGVCKAFPVQHMINVLLAVLLGWQFSLAGAFCISSIRIAMGMGTLLAYPGSMIGAVLSGILYQRTGSLWAAVAGEIFGTGILGGLISVPVAAILLDSQAVSLFFFVIAFLPNTILGSALACLILKFLPARDLIQRHISHRI
jgi:energy coupling factor transporter S component ThiW